jgi:hypothetical protein
MNQCLTIVATFINVVSNDNKRAVFDSYRDSNDDNDDTENDDMRLRANCICHRNHTRM